MKIKLGEYLIPGQSNKREVFLYCPDNQSEGVKCSSVESLKLEVNIGLTGVEGYRLTEEEAGSIVNEFCLAPDIMYELFLFFKKIDKQEFPEDYTG